MGRKFLVLLGLLLSGCPATIWQDYETPNYTPSRADQVCHPYGRCSQGKWVAKGRPEEDAAHTYAACRDEIRQPGDGWFQSSVSIGLEIGRCMRSKGYELVSQ